jgi:hypothetical protein
MGNSPFATQEGLVRDTWPGPGLDSGIQAAKTRIGENDHVVCIANDKKFLQLVNRFPQRVERRRWRFRR